MDAAAAGLPVDRVMEADTEVGTIWVEKGAHILTDALVNLGIWEPAVSGLIRNALEPGMTFVDAGANIGYLTIIASKTVGPEGRVFAVEADEENRKLLEANLERTGSDNVTVIPYAAWNERAELQLERPEHEGAVSKVGTDGTMADYSGLTPAARLDELIDGPVDYLKVDCELTDHVVVEGSRGLLDANPEMLITVEFHPKHASHLGDTPEQVLAVYKELGLSPFAIADDGSLIEPTTWDRIASPKLPKGHISFDFLAARNPPTRLPMGRAWPNRRERIRRELAARGILARAGDLLEYVPEPIRPKIRDRDKTD